MKWLKARRERHRKWNLNRTEKERHVYNNTKLKMKLFFFVTVCTFPKANSMNKFEGGKKWRRRWRPKAASHSISSKCRKILQYTSNQFGAIASKLSEFRILIDMVNRELNLICSNQRKKQIRNKNNMISPFIGGAGDETERERVTPETKWQTLKKKVSLKIPNC